MNTEDTALTFSSAYGLQVVSYCHAASLMLLVYDYFLTLDLEVDLIWRSKFSFVNVLYFLSRYTMFVDAPLLVYIVTAIPHIPTKTCILASEIWHGFAFFGLVSVHAILAVRTTALWEHNRKIVWSLWGLLSLTVVGCLVIAYMHLKSTAIQSLSTNCGFNGSPTAFFIIVLILIFETVIVILTTLRWYNTIRHSTSPLIVTIYRDGILFFVCLFLVSLVNIIIQSSGPSDLQGLMIGLQSVMHSILSCRIVLHVRKAGRAAYVYR